MVWSVIITHYEDYSNPHYQRGRHDSPKLFSTLSQANDYVRRHLISEINQFRDDHNT